MENANIYQKEQIPVSVVMPVFNMESYIKDAMDSILNQTFIDFEFIIIDDGSTDNTWNVIQSYKDKRIVSIRNKTNLGNYPSRNEGIKIATGKYIAVMDADDIAMPDRLKKQYEYLEKNPDLIALSTGYQVSSEDVKKEIPVSYENICFDLLKAFNLLHPSLMVESHIIRSIGGYDEKYKYASDYNLFCRLSLIGKLESLPDVLMIYRTHSGQISQYKKREQNRCANAIRRKYQVDFINKYKSDNQHFSGLAEVGIPEIGLSICYYTYAESFKRKDYRDLADRIIDVIDKIMTKKIPASIENGLCGLGCGLHYLVQNKFLDGDVDEVLEDIDNKIIDTLREKNDKDKEYITDMLFYMNYRISKSANTDSQRIRNLISVYSEFINTYQ